MGGLLKEGPSAHLRCLDRKYANTDTCGSWPSFKPGELRLFTKQTVIEDDTHDKANPRP